MSVNVEHEVRLSPPGGALTYYLDAQRTLEPGGPGWKELLAAIHAVVSGAWCQHQIGLTAYIGTADAPGGDRAALYLALVHAGHWDDNDRDAVTSLIHDTDLPWRAEGLRPCLPEAIPLVTISEDATWHLWHLRDGQAVVCFYTLSPDGDVELLCEPAHNTDPSVFPPDMAHARVRVVAAEDDAPALVELMRVAWTLHYAERMVEVDGHAADSELALLSRTFPARRLSALGLSDRATCVRLRTLAHTQLAPLLSESERLAMLGLLFRLAQADGTVVPAETQLLQEACDVLQLEWASAQRTMLERWG